MWKWDSPETEERETERKSDVAHPRICDGIPCSSMCRCQGNSNLVTSLFQPNPVLKLWPSTLLPGRPDNIIIANEARDTDRERERGEKKERERAGERERDTALVSV